MKVLSLEIPPNLLHLKSLILSVYAISRELGVKHIDINRSLKEFRLPNGRGLTIDIKGMQIIDDSYNANPSSVILAITCSVECNNLNFIAITSP